MIRLLARVDIRNMNHIKTINCEGVRKLRDLRSSFSLFSEGQNEHDGIIVIDTVASLYSRVNCMLSSNNSHLYIPIPLSIGGGISSADQVVATLAKGADKILLNTAAISNPSLITEIAQKVGKQSVVLQIDVKKIHGDYKCFTHGGRELSHYSLADWLSAANHHGAGEVHVTSIDTEGTNRPFPLELAYRCASLTDLPIILSGGFRDPGNIVQIYNDCNISAFSLSSYTNILGNTISDLRNQLFLYGIPVRKT